MTVDERYRKLSGRTGFIMLNRLYLGRDHLLLVQTAFGYERYVRFYFRDLESFSIHRTTRNLWEILIFGAITLLAGTFVFLLWPQSASESVVGTVFWGIVGVCFGVPFVATVMRGPTCRSFVRTAVQTTQLPSLNRWRVALKVRKTIREQVLASQPEAESSAASRQEVREVGVSAATEASVSVKDGLPGAESTDTGKIAARGTLREAPVGFSVAAARTAAPKKSVVSAGDPRFVRCVNAAAATAIACIVAAAAILFDYIEPAGWGLAVNVAGVLLAASATITHLVIASGSETAKAARFLSLGVFVALSLGFFGGYAAIVSVVFDSGGSQVPAMEHEIYLMLAAIAPGENKVVDVSYIVVATAFLLNGVFATLVWVRSAARRREALKAG